VFKARRTNCSSLTTQQQLQLQSLSDAAAVSFQGIDSDVPTGMEKPKFLDNFF